MTTHDRRRWASSLNPRQWAGGGAVLLLLGFAAGHARPALATCGAAGCFLVTETDQGILTTGVFRVGLSFRYVDQSRKLDGSDSVQEVLVPRISFEEEAIEPDHHREISTLSSTLQLDMSYGLNKRWSLTGVVPLLVDRAHEHFDEAGTPDEHFSNSDGTRGFGDMQLGFRTGLWVRPKDLLIVGLSLKLPTGPYRIRDSEGEINEPTIQPGSGSYDLLGSLSYSHRAVPTGPELFGSVTYRYNTTNPLEYQVGSETTASFGGTLPIGPRLEVLGQINARWTGRDSYLDAQVPSTGATYVNLTPGLRYNTDAGSTLFAYVQWPAYQHVNDDQLAPRYGFVAGISKGF